MNRQALVSGKSAKNSTSQVKNNDAEAVDHDSTPQPLSAAGLAARMRALTAAMSELAAKYRPTSTLRASTVSVKSPSETKSRPVQATEAAGATAARLRLHLDTALSACTQALSLVGPLLPEI